MRQEPVFLDADGVVLPGDLVVPPAAPGIVVFAHGSGSSRRSSRNRFVAERLTEAGLGTLLFDLLTPGEELDRANVFDVDLLARRLGAPTLLIVGGNDPEVLRLNRQAYQRLRCVKRLEIVPGATHLFEERGTLEAAAALATDWFLEFLPRSG